METKRYITTSPDETEKIGAEIRTQVRDNAFLALYGDLGAGKTAFVRGFIQSALPDAIVTSPTYNIVNKYTYNDKNIYHFDMYRITDDDDLYSVGFYDYLDNGVIISEWSENIPFAIPEEHVKITIKKLSCDNEREITVEFINDNTGN